MRILQPRARCTFDGTALGPGGAKFRPRFIIDWLPRRRSAICMLAATAQGVAPSMTRWLAISRRMTRAPSRAQMRCREMGAGARDWPTTRIFPAHSALSSVRMAGSFTTSLRAAHATAVTLVTPRRCSAAPTIFRRWLHNAVCHSERWRKTARAARAQDAAGFSAAPPLYFSPLVTPYHGQCYIHATPML